MLDQSGPRRRRYVTTSPGVQVLDQPGRVDFIIRKPEPKWVSNVTFGGPERRTLYVTCCDSVWKLRLRTTGFDPWKALVTPQKTGL